MDFRSQRCNVDRGIGKRGEYAADILREDGRKVALQIDDDFGLAPGVELADRLVNPVRPGRMIGARHDRLKAMGDHDSGDLRRVGSDRHAADLSCLGPAQHMDDHRQAGDIQ
jgi:hypothetical protein